VLLETFFVIARSNCLMIFPRCTADCPFSSRPASLLRGGGGPRILENSASIAYQMSRTSSPSI